MKKIIITTLLAVFSTYAMAEIVIINTPTGTSTCIVQQGVITCL